jgi:hypothetical protein
MAERQPPVGTGKTHSPAGKAAPPATHTAAGPAPGVTSPSLSGPSNPAAAEAIKATDVSGRSEPQRVRLSAGTATNATGTAASTNLASAAGQPALTPGMVPPLAGTPSGSGSRNGQKIVQHTRSAEEAELQGINTIGEAVRGGTILQRRYDDGTA